jgi:VanZ family protein|tara:strand:- start:2016 stop:2381 length:366 start_codon:yes stop_codon:yes gene_type:complete
MTFIKKWLSHPVAFRIAFVLYGLLVVWASLKPSGGPQPIEHFDKVMHFTFYGLFTIIAAGCTTQRKTFIWLSIFIILYGALMEIFQSFVPSRFMSIADIVANTSGIVIVAVLFLKIRFRRL